MEKEEATKEEPFVFEPITIEYIRQDKGFQKSTHKLQKEYDTLKKKQSKEKLAVQKSQCSAVDKLVKGKNKSDLVNDPAMRKLVQEQTVQWSELMERHCKQEWEYFLNQLDDQHDVLRKHMEILQAGQMKQLEARHERELKELIARQVKISVETSKEIKNDKMLKTKQEKDWRLRQLQYYNTKKFFDERKAATIKQVKEKEKLKLKHEIQLDMLSHDIQKKIEMYKNEQQ